MFAETLSPMMERRREYLARVGASARVLHHHSFLRI